MKKLKELDTSCKAIYKNGDVKEFSSIEEASDKTGITVASIKIRCNKSSTKTWPQFKWLNEKTAAHYRAKKSKNKGQALETEIVNKLKEIGYSHVCRSAGESKSLDNNKVDISDPSGELEVAIQAKHMQVYPNYHKIQSQTTDPRDFVLIWKKSAEGGTISDGTVAVMNVDFFYKLLKCYHENN